jgi:hypothetical protein
VSCGSASGVAEGLVFFRKPADVSSDAAATTDAGDVTLAPQMEQKRAVRGRAPRHRAHAMPAPTPREDPESSSS